MPRPPDTPLSRAERAEIRVHRILSELDLALSVLHVERLREVEAITFPPGEVRSEFEARALERAKSIDALHRRIAELIDAADLDPTLPKPSPREDAADAFRRLRVAVLQWVGRLDG